MANYYEIFSSNKFQTKDNKKVVEVLSQVFEEAQELAEGVYFGQLESDYTFSEYITILFKGDKVVAVYDNDCDCKEEHIKEGDNPELYKEVNLIDYLQENLLPDQYITVKGIGWEKLCYINSYIVVIDKKEYLRRSLDECEEEMLASIGHKQ